jgi:hypothetical protein
MPPPAQEQPQGGETPEEDHEALLPHGEPEPEPEPEPELEPELVASADGARPSLAFDGGPPLTFSVNHFGLKGQRAGTGFKRGDVLTTWRERYFVLHEDGNFLVYFLSATESEPRGALPLGGGTFEATDDHDGCGLRLRLRGTGENLLAFDTTAERDAWLEVLQQAAGNAYVDSVANRALLPLLPSLLARAQSVFFGAPGALARHTLGEGLMPEEWVAISEVVRAAVVAALCPQRRLWLCIAAPPLTAFADLAAVWRVCVCRRTSTGVSCAPRLSSSGCSAIRSSARRKASSVRFGHPGRPADSAAIARQQPPRLTSTLCWLRSA